MKQETQLRGQYSPGSILAKVKRVESFATKQEEKARAASFWCSCASSLSRVTWKLLVPEMFLVPPAPAPWLSTAFLRTSRTKLQNSSHNLIQPVLLRLYKNYNCLVFRETVKIDQPLHPNENGAMVFLLLHKKVRTNQLVSVFLYLIAPRTRGCRLIPR